MPRKKVSPFLPTHPLAKWLLPVAILFGDDIASSGAVPILETSSGIITALLQLLEGL